MFAYQRERIQVADLLIELGRALQICEQKDDILNAEAFRFSKDFSSKQVMKGLAGKQPPG